MHVKCKYLISFVILNYKIKIKLFKTLFFISFINIINYNHKNFILRLKAIKKFFYLLHKFLLQFLKTLFLIKRQIVQEYKKKYQFFGIAEEQRKYFFILLYKILFIYTLRISYMYIYIYMNFIRGYYCIEREVFFYIINFINMSDIIKNNKKKQTFTTLFT